MRIASGSARRPVMSVIAKVPGRYFSSDFGMKRGSFAEIWSFEFAQHATPLPCVPKLDVASRPCRGLDPSVCPVRLANTDIETASGVSARSRLNLGALPVIRKAEATRGMEWSLSVLWWPSAPSVAPARGAGYVRSFAPWFARHRRRAVRLVA